MTGHALVVLLVVVVVVVVVVALPPPPDGLATLDVLQHECAAFVGKLPSRIRQDSGGLTLKASNMAAFSAKGQSLASASLA